MAGEDVEEFMKGQQRILGVKHEHSEAAYKMLENYDADNYHKAYFLPNFRFNQQFLGRFKIGLEGRSPRENPRARTRILDLDSSAVRGNDQVFHLIETIMILFEHHWQIKFYWLKNYWFGRGYVRDFLLNNLLVLIEVNCRYSRLFDSDFLESLTRTVWYVVPLVWLPVVALFSFFALSEFYHSYGWFEFYFLRIIPRKMLLTDPLPWNSRVMGVEWNW